MDLQRFGEQLSKRRKALNLSVREVARRTELSPGTISDIEHGKQLPSRATMMLLSEILGVQFLIWNETIDIAPIEEEEE